MISRRAFLGTVTGGLLAAPLAAEAQQPARVARIGYLEFGSAAPGMPQVEALRQGLRDLGWIEGQNIAIEDAARVLKVQLHPVPVQDPNELENAFSVLARKRTQALTVIMDGMFLAQRDRILALAARSRLPAMYGSSDLAEAGGLMAYGVNLPELYQRGASYIDRILKGAKPADLPVERPTRFYLVINLKTAKTLGLTIPQALLQRADQVIE